MTTPLSAPPAPHHAHRILTAGLALLLGAAANAIAAEPHPAAPIAEVAASAPLTIGTLSLDLSRAMLQPETSPPQPTSPAGADSPAAAEPAPIPPSADAELRPGYGRAGSSWLTVGTGLAYDFGEAKDFNIHAAYSQFLADELEFGVELGGWYFAQDGDDTGGISGSMVLRWHHWHADDYSWTFFSDVGIGILAAFDEVPQGGQEINFLPRAGAGFTQRLGDDGTRLMVGARWHHISNGRYTGDTRNPSRDSVMVYAGIVVPF